MTSVKVAVRVRPLNKRELDMDSKFVIQMDGKKTIITNTKMDEHSLEGVSETTRESMRVKEFTFDFSFWTVDKQEARYCDQDQVYNSLGVDVVDSGFEGYNACVFAYGQTGSGKTYTMMGNPGDVGLIPRICQELFHRMTDETTSYRTEVSYLEIYNEKVRDLLKATNNGQVVHNLRVREHPKEGPYVQGLSKYIVGSFEEIEALMMKGNSVRTTASTNMNDVSSRSHAIFTIVFTQATIKDGIPSEKTSKIHLVDLAGSERATATGATGQRLREGGSINKSLVSLGTVIKQLAEVSEKGARPGKGHFVPYRDSVLTWLLKDSLGGNSRTIMITTISPADCNYAESLSALRYANRAKNIINRPTVNEDLNVRLIRELREEIERLKTMIGGDIDSISTPKVKERLHESEARMKVLTEEWSEKWKDIASILKEQGTLALRKEGLGVVLDSALPHLIGIDDDILSTGIMLFHLKEGKTRIGSSEANPPVDIVIAGQEVEKEHCALENANSAVTLIPLDNSSCFVNGNQVSEPTKLKQGAVILLGKTNMFRYNNPAEAAQMKKELQKSGMTFSLSRTSLLSQSMTDLYRSSENLSASSGLELEQSHREEQERIEELRSEIKVLEDRYHAAEEERINKQVGLEMELEKRQKLLERACKDLEKVQLEIVQNHEKGGVSYKIPKGAQIGDLLKKLDEREFLLTETARVTRETLMEKMETLKVENEKDKDVIQEKLASVDDKCRMKETEIKLLEDELQLKKQAASDQDSEDQKVINEEKQLLTKMKEDFEVLFRSKSETDKMIKMQLDDLDEHAENVKKQFEEKEIEMRDRWKADVDAIANENKEIDEAWSDLREQEKEYTDLLEADNLGESERTEIEVELEQLETAKGLLKLEEEKVAVRERKILDSIEVEMDKWEEYKKQEEQSLKEKKTELARTIGSDDLNQLINKIEGKEADMESLLEEVVKQKAGLAEFEKSVLEKTALINCDIDDLEKEKGKCSDEQCKSVIKLEKDVIEINEELNRIDNKLNEDLKEIEEERQNLKMLQEFQNFKSTAGTVDISQVEEKLEQIDLTEEEEKQMEDKRKELEELQAAADKANEELEEKVRQFDLARDTELDTIELERVNLQDRVRQDRINALVEQEVKRRMFEEKVQREQKRQLERNKEKQEREEEIKRLKEAHFREIKQLKAKYQRRSGQEGRTMTPSRSNPYVTVMSADSEGDVPRRKSTGSQESPVSSVHITIPFYRLQCYGSDSHYEYEVKIVIGDDFWSVMRRYKQFREFHMNLKNRYPQIGALVFPPKKFFSKTEKVAAERRQQLEFYMRSVVEICSQIEGCVLHSSRNQFLSKQVLCDFDSFFRKGLFENTKYGTT